MGYVVVIEGTDGSGKKTQSENLYRKLLDKGFNVKLQSFPNYDSPSSSAVKMYLGGEFGEHAENLDAYQGSILFSVDRLCTYLKDLKSFYESGGVLIFDRYVESNMLHQACKIGDIDKLNKYLEWLDTLEFDILKLPRPNKVIFLDVPVETSKVLANDRKQLKNGQTKDIHEDDLEHLKNAYNTGKYVSKVFNWDIINCVKDDKMRSIDDIANEIFDIVIKDLK